MRVKEFMQTKVIAVPSSTSLYDARKIMVENKIKRLPVVDNGKLVGITSLNRIREASPSEATTLSIHELHYLISKMTVKDIMKTDVVTCHPDDPVEDVALIMHTRQIGAMPVVDEKRSLIGFVSSNDLFKIVVVMMGFDRPVSRITVEFDRDTACSKIDKLINLLDQSNLCIRSLVRFDKNGTLCDYVIRVEAAEINKFVEMALKEGYKVISYMTGKHETKI